MWFGEPTRFPKEDHVPDWARRDNKVTKGDRVDIHPDLERNSNLGLQCSSKAHVNTLIGWQCHHDVNETTPKLCPTDRRRHAATGKRKKRRNCLFNDAASCEDYLASIMDEIRVGSTGGMTREKGTAEVLGEEPVSLSLCLKQIPRGLAQDRTLASAVRGRRQTAYLIFSRVIIYSLCFCSPQLLRHRAAHVRQQTYWTPNA